MRTVSLVLGFIVLAVAVDAIATTVSFDAEGADRDGYLKESDVGSGEGAYAVTSGDVRVGDLWNDTRVRGILSFDTSSLPMGAVVTEVTLSLRAESKNGSPFSEFGDVEIDVFRGSFGADSVLSPSDFEAASGPEGTAVASIADPGSPPVSFTQDMDDAASLVNDAGRTQLRLRFDADSNEDGTEDRVHFSSGNTSVKASLEVVYHTGERVPGFVPPDYEESEYDVGVNLSGCNYTIDTSLTSWSSVPWSTKDTICIEAGDYTALGTLEIHGISGTSGSPKSLRYYEAGNGNPDHPVVRADSSGPEAVIKHIDIDDADYWIFQGLTIRDMGSGSTSVSNFVVNSSHNVFDRLLIEDVSGVNGIFLALINDSDGNVVQNSVFRDANGGENGDTPCVMLYSQHQSFDSYDANRELEDTIIVNNEFINCSDGILTNRTSNALESVEGAYYPGTVIENNDIYLTPDVYTDCEGNWTTTGDCACAENGIDLKATVAPGDWDDDDKRFRVLNNRIWGYRDADSDCGPTLGANGDALMLHDTSRAALIQGNVVWDSVYGIAVTSSAATTEDVGDVDEEDTHNYVVNNLIYGTSSHGIRMNRAMDFNYFYGNTVVGTSGLWAWLTDSTGETNEENVVACNAAVNSGGSSFSVHDYNVSEWNGFYNTTEYCPTSCDNDDYGSDYHDAWTFHIKRWTGPVTQTIGDAVRSPSTPDLTSSFNADCDYKDASHPWN